MAKSLRRSKGYPHIAGQLLSADVLIPYIRRGEVTRARRLIIRPSPQTAHIRQSTNPAMPEYWLALDQDGRVINGMQCAYGTTGQFLVLRESYAIVRPRGDGTYESLADTPPGGLPEGWELRYRCERQHSDNSLERGFKWKPAIWMPRWAARTLLEVKSVQAVRIQHAPSDEHLIALGAQAPIFEAMWRDATRTERRQVGNHKGVQFRWDRGSPLQLWEWSWQLYQSDASWMANPWCWDIEFKAHPVESVHAP